MSALPKTLAQKSSYRLFIWGLLLIPFAVLADAVLDAVLFNHSSVLEQLFSPSYHELAIRALFCTFILAAIYLGMHYLANVAQKEASLLRRNRDLALARQDLEEFQEDVLRQLRNTSSELATSIGLLGTQCSPELNEKTRFLIENVDKVGDKLGRQLEISLALTEIPFSEPHRQRVKLDKLALEVATELQSKQPDRQTEFKIQPWLNGWCDKKMLRFVIYNLFCNALEGIPPSRPGQIEFGSFNRGNQKVFYVRDNGLGYSDVQAKRLFDSFRDSAHDREMPKNTVRLASARRVIHRHGGQIWAEGIEGAGGTVFFTYYSV